MSTYSNTGDSIVGTFLLGVARTVDPMANTKFLFPNHNKKQFLLTKKSPLEGIPSECVVKKCCRINIPFHYNKIKIHMQKDDWITGNDIYCECTNGEPTGKKGRRYLKLGKLHGQGWEFDGDLTIAVVFKEFMQTSHFALNKQIGLDAIIESKATK